MPNWCECELHMNGSREGVQAVLGFVSDFGDVTLDFNLIVPAPKELLHENRLLMTDGMRVWRDEHWGTKWTASEVRWDEGENVLRFHTAWSPPVPVIKALAAKFTTVEFVLEYFERGMAFSGGYRARFVNGQDVTEEKEWQCEYYGNKGG